MHIAILGRQPSLGMAELERLYGDVSWFGKQTALISAETINIARLGGSQKIGLVIHTMSTDSWQKVSTKIVQEYYSKWQNNSGKITLGISAYGFKANPREIQKTGIVLKNKLKSSGTSLRLLPNQDLALSTATSHHNKLGLSDNKVELIVVSDGHGKVVIAESTGSQNITAYANRDQARPKRDAFVGMLPPKLAQIMINLSVDITSSYVPAITEHLQPEIQATPGPDLNPGAKPFREGRDRKDDSGLVILDPFCGTGVILQEAALMGLSVYGTDLAEKMVRYSRDNLNWLSTSHHISFDWYLHEGDATNTQWRQPISAVVTESYLGQPFSAPPSPAKLTEVMGNCNNIITAFLKNIGSQIEVGTPLCVAVPAWKQTDGSFSHLPIVDTLGKYGYKPFEFKNVSKNDLLYYREDQVVARELLVMTKA